MMRRAILLAALVACSSDRGKAAPPAEDSMTTSNDTVILHSARTATRLVLSPSGRYAVAELGGAGPPELKVIDVDKDAVTSTHQGWVVAVSDTGDLDFLADDGSGGIALRSTKRAGDAPIAAAGWQVQAAAATPSAAVVVLTTPVDGAAWKADERDEKVLLVRLSLPAGSIEARREITVRKWEHWRRAVAIAPGSLRIFVVSADEPADRWRVEAFDDALNPAWKADLPRPVDDDDHHEAILTASEQGPLLLAAGVGREHGLLPEQVFALDGGDGSVLGAPPKALTSGGDVVGEMTAASGAVAWFPIYMQGTDGSARVKAYLVSLSTIDLGNGTIVEKYAPERRAGDKRTREMAMAPVALAWDASRGRIVIAPP